MTEPIQTPPTIGPLTPDDAISTQGNCSPPRRTPPLTVGRIVGQWLSDIEDEYSNYYLYAKDALQVESTPYTVAQERMAKQQLAVIRAISAKVLKRWGTMVIESDSPGIRLLAAIEDWTRCQANELERGGRICDSAALSAKSVGRTDGRNRS